MTDEVATTESAEQAPNKTKPSWGRVILMFLACWTLCFCGNFFMTWIMLGYPTRGGLVPLIAGIILAVMYRKGAFSKRDGRLGATLYLMDAAVVVGIIVGIVSCFVTAGLAYSYSAASVYDASSYFAQLSDQSSGVPGLFYTFASQWLDAFGDGRYFVALMNFLLPAGVIFFIGGAIVHVIGKIVEVASRK
ncbi:MAG: hypothetical protein ACOYIP_07055 [Coriobacteriales bacterium]|jgi:hypothetical protein